VTALIKKHGPRTRPEVIGELKQTALPAEGQAPIHLLGLASLQMRIIRGPDRGTRDAYALFDEWVPRSDVPPRAEALADLARRYLEAYGAATFDDFRAWSGLPAADLRAGWAAIEDERVEVESEIGPLTMLDRRSRGLAPRPLRGPRVRLLPAWDNYWLGYRRREFAMAPEYARHVQPGGGMIPPVVLVDGRITGRWTISKRGSRLEVTVQPFERFGRDLELAVEREVEDIGRFLGLDASLRRVVV
jgi:hypothetical protein